MNLLREIIGNKKLLLKQIKAASSFAGTDAIIIYINPSGEKKIADEVS